VSEDQDPGRLQLKREAFGQASKLISMVLKEALGGVKKNQVDCILR
jgi:hypothetical protein